MRDWIGLAGHIIGRGPRPDGAGMLAVFLDHDPTDFGLRANQVAYHGELRTALSHAIDTDLEDDGYDLSWLNQLSGHHGPQDIVKLRKLLIDERDRIGRHFMLTELAKCLYESRDAFPSAFEDFDAVCEQHHVDGRHPTGPSGEVRKRPDRRDVSAGRDPLSEGARLASDDALG